MLRRFSIAHLMGLIALVAFNIAALRWALATNRELMIDYVPIVLALEFGAVRAARTDGRGRAFWAGFLAACVLVFVAILPPLCHGPEGFLEPTGPTSYVFAEAKPASTIWLLYFRYNQALETWIGPGFAAVSNPPNLTLIRNACFMFLPQLVIALAGGWLARFAIGRLTRRDRPGPSGIMATEG